MSVALSPRPYQADAVTAVDNYLRTVDKKNPCVVMPTGSGKSIVIAKIVFNALTLYPGTRICAPVHVRELVRQNADKLARLWPAAPIGIYSASLRRDDRFNPIIFANIQSVHNKAKRLGRFDLMIVDEAHRIPFKQEGTYRNFIDDNLQMNPDLRVIGLTATPWRMTGGPICDDAHVLNEICYEAHLRDLIADGYLTTLISKNGVARPDLSDVKINNGEYSAAGVDVAVRRDNLVARACKEITELCHDRKKWILFAANVAHAHDVCRELESYGIKGAVLTGKTPAGERDEIIQSFKHGRVRFLVNVSVLVEGFDEEGIDAVIMLGPTKSPCRYSQEVGRGTRPVFASGYDLESREGRLAAIAAGPKPNCLVLDFAGNIVEHGPVDQIEVKKPKKKGDSAVVHVAPVKECPNCHAVVVIQVGTCDCGYVWPRGATPHDDTATDAPILSTELASRVHSHTVTAISYGKHIKPNRPPCLKVTYSCNLRTFAEYVTLEHSGESRARAVAWWNGRNCTRDLSVPRSVDEALTMAEQRRLREPTHITVNHAGKHSEVIGAEF